MAVIRYLKSFAIDQEFREKQMWVKAIQAYCHPIHHDIWSSSRFFGGLVTLITEYFAGLPLAIVVFLLFSMTDFIDGLVARSRNASNGKLGSFLDGTADKVFIIPIFIAWGRNFVPLYLIYLLAAVEFGGALVVFLLNRKKFIDRLNGIIGFFFPGKYLPNPAIMDDIYAHNSIGKFKFGLQVAIGIFFGAANMLTPGWGGWSFGMVPLVLLTILLSFFSSAIKINPKIVRF